MELPWTTAIKEGVSGLLGLVKDPLVEWQKRKTVNAQAKNEVVRLNAEASVENAKARVEMAKNGQQIEADWDQQARNDMKFSWKDEFLMVLLFLPVTAIFIAAFFPGNYGAVVQANMIKAVNSLDKFPMWYVILLMGIVAAVYGLRWLIAPLVQRKMAFLPGRAAGQIPGPEKEGDGKSS
ncbi:MAG TPA: hypothetical protein DHV36_03740 [Desulfobacteraceae bacterium]|nr:hypothetical protein [Desulfobacteraceae bacterium]